MSGSAIGWSQTASGSIGNTLTLLTQSSTPGQTRLGGYYIDNPNSSPVYLQIFDAKQTSDVTLGTTAPKLSLSIPATGAANLSIANGIRFFYGIVIAFTSTRSGNTSPGTSCDYNIWFD